MRQATTIKQHHPVSPEQRREKKRPWITDVISLTTLSIENRAIAAYS
jgi:hypothetical protein